METIIARLREPSTAVAISVLIGVAGKQVTPETVHAAIELAAVLAAIAGAVLPERGKAA